MDNETDALEDRMFQPYGFTVTPKHRSNNSSTFKVPEEDGKAISDEIHTPQGLRRSCRTIEFQPNLNL